MCSILLNLISVSITKQSFSLMIFVICFKFAKLPEVRMLFEFILRHPSYVSIWVIVSLNQCRFNISYSFETSNLIC